MQMEKQKIASHLWFDKEGIDVARGFCGLLIV